MLKANFDKVEIITNSENLGFAKANNIAIACTNNKYIFLLNSDTELETNIIDIIIDYMECNLNVSMLGCKLKLPDGTRQVGDAGYEPTVSSAFNYSFLLSKLLPNKFKGLYHNNNKISSPILVDWVSGAALLIRRSVVDKVGPLSEKYFMFTEDIEWGVRVKQFGGTVVYFPQASVMHHLGGSLSDQDKMSTSWIENLLLYFKSKETLLNYRLFTIIMCFGLMVRCTVTKFMVIVKPNVVAIKKYITIKSAFIVLFKKIFE
jgi:GT2 family glycosyltransferase